MHSLRSDVQTMVKNKTHTNFLWYMQNIGSRVNGRPAPAAADVLQERHRLQITTHAGAIANHMTAMQSDNGAPERPLLSVY